MPKRCFWCNLNNPVYVRYHDEEWGRPQHEDGRLFELLILEPFQAGLSWETVLRKREHFRQAFAGFDPVAVSAFPPEQVDALMQDPGIIRNRKKIEAAIRNAAVFLEIQKEWGSFQAYFWHFTQGRSLRETGRTSSPLSDAITRDLKARGMTFLGTTTVYSWLQAAGVIQSHEEDCFLYDL